MKHPLAETQHQNRVFDVQDKLFLDKEREINEMISYIRKMAFKNENCLKIMKHTKYLMNIEEYQHRIVTLPNLLIEKH